MTVFPATERPAFPQAALQRTSRNRCFISTRNRRTSSTVRPSRASKLCIIGSPRRSSSDGSGLLAFMTISRMVSLVFGTRLETFTPVVHGEMRIKADVVLSGGRSCLVTVRDLPADHDEPLTPERRLRRNPVGHKQSAKPDWGLSSFRSLRLPSLLQRPYNDKVDQPVAPVIEPLNTSGRPNHPRPVIRRGRGQPPGGEGPVAVQPRSLLWTDCDRRLITSVRFQAAMA